MRPIRKSSGNYGTPIKRGITRIITPGTVIEEGMLIAKKIIGLLLFTYQKKTQMNLMNGVYQKLM